MEFERIVKRLEWLDEEHRKDRAAMAAMEGQLAALETTLSTVVKQVKELSKKVAESSLADARIAQFEEVIARQRADFSQALEALEKKHQRREREALKRHQAELEELNKALVALNQSRDVEELRRKLKERADEDIRLNVAITEIKPQAEEALRKAEDAVQTYKLLEDSRRQDVKRVADLQGEIAAVRKRVDEFRQKVELQGDSLRVIENRFTELIVSENERKQAQAAFLEQQALAQVDRDRVYKEWREKFEAFKQQAAVLDTQTQVLDETLRAAKRAQDTYLELNQKLERRINEVTEMQRLAEERLRQEWITFKADDQKRWVGYTLSQEEAMRDIRKMVDQFNERLAAMDDMAQTLQDLLHQTTDATEQQLQELMNVAHEWLTAYKRIMGHTRKPPQ